MIEIDSGQIVEANRAARRFYEHAVEELVGVPIWNLSELSETDTRALWYAAEQGVIGSFEDRHLVGDQDYRDVEIYTGAMRAEGLRYQFYVVHNISARKHAERARRRVEEELRTVAAAFETQEAIVITDPDARIQRVNQAFSHITGYPADEVVGETPRILKSGRHDEAFYQQMWRQLMQQGSWEGEIWNRRKNGEIYPEWLSITRVEDETGMLQHYVGHFVDISERKEYEQALETARDMAESAARAKGAFLAMMSHEIRTPMNGVLGMLQLMEGTGLSREQNEYIRTAAESSEVLMTLIDDILDFSKVEVGKLKLESIDFDLHFVIESTVELLSEKAHRKGVEMISQIHTDVPRWCRGDPNRLRQILNNLVGNAVKFTDAGEVLVRAVVKRSEAYGLALRIEVVDTGIGIGADEQQHIFDAFSQADGSTTRRFGGTGLGLAITKRLINHMGGAIYVESAPQRGSTFRFEIPLREAQEPHHERMDRSLQGRRILVVDDHRTNLEVCEEMLRRAGASVSGAESAAQAWDLLVAAAGTEQAFDLAVVDYMMPQEDGFSLARRIRAHEQLSRLPMILLTSFGQAGEEEQAQTIGFQGFLTKPLRQGHFEEMVERVLLGEVVHRTMLTRARLGVEPEGPRGRVLVAEDNEVNQKVIVAMLKRLGYGAEVVDDGAQAVAAVSAGGYDLVLMDCQMPVMDGFSATERIREQQAEAAGATPIVALTANAMEGVRERCLEVGMDDYIAKPMRQERLAEILARWAKG